MYFATEKCELKRKHQFSAGRNYDYDDRNKQATETFIYSILYFLTNLCCTILHYTKYYFTRIHVTPKLIVTQMHWVCTLN